VNDNMGMLVANKVIKLMIKRGQSINASKALLLGITFKENSPDLRNSRVIDIYHELRQLWLQVDVYDPHTNKEVVFEVYQI
jgi:UDP-N-acetyl-D-galactosamine dehydrogenase